MTSIHTFRNIALSLPEAEEQPHFEQTSFRVKKKIFATLNMVENRACLKFSELDQSAFCSFDRDVIYPVPNKWGKQGWTLINLALIKKEMLQDALETAYCTVAPKKLAQPILARKENTID
ncbi:hypothetical protein CJD36_016370 [Flavipsychrobacter stenotrophus]|uniref:MmcQ-like protein n=1 Tax=Flavipsychrobacter stenotrophus TaxID=2077091 RepID=A0A2S7STJ5_9BACT|nr:MmcQ/YjbR family DNA-binding protein [Flavipsychrobacter stenotrophus]PQJ10259.1 hypothetical protein CJD36_016370 [Flavipsychrobacter stenotrophus]